MAMRCPTAKVVGIGKLKNTRLIFWRVATIIKEEGAETPVAVWVITSQDERALDRYEGYPHLYRKEDATVHMADGKELTAMVYIMNEGRPQMPNKGYYAAIEKGYADVGLDPSYLYEAVRETQNRMK